MRTKEADSPEILFQLADAIAEGMWNKKSNDFMTYWPEIINPKTNLAKVKHRFYAFLLKENLQRVSSVKTNNQVKEQAIESISEILRFHESETTKYSTAAWLTAWWSAELVAMSAMMSDEPAIAEAARSAARTAVDKAAEAVKSSANSVAEAAKPRILGFLWRVKAYNRYAKKFMHLLRNTQ